MVSELGAMDSDALQALSYIDDLSSSNDLPRRTGRSFPFSNWKGKCIGDDACSISENVVRVVAFQTAGCICEIGAWVDGAVSQLRCTGAHAGIYAETRIHFMDRHTRIINAFKTRGFLFLTHSTSSRQVDCAPKCIIYLKKPFLRIQGKILFLFINCLLGNFRTKTRWKRVLDLIHLTFYILMLLESSSIKQWIKTYSNRCAQCQTKNNLENRDFFTINPFWI